MLNALFNHSLSSSSTPGLMQVAVHTEMRKAQFLSLSLRGHSPVE